MVIGSSTRTDPIGEAPSAAAASPTPSETWAVDADASKRKTLMDSFLAGIVNS